MLRHKNKRQTITLSLGGDSIVLRSVWVCVSEHHQQIGRGRSVIQCFLTCSSNWTPVCWQQRSMSWQHQASGGVGQHVGQWDMMSDEKQSRAGPEQQRWEAGHDQWWLRTERGQRWSLTGTEDRNQTDLKQDWWRLWEGQRKQHEGHR